MGLALGVVCTKNELLFALADDDAVLGDPHEKLKLPVGIEETERLLRALRDIKRTLAEVKPEQVRVLLPEQTYKDSYARIAPRVTLETLMRIACADAGIAVEMLHRASARSRLGMPRSGKFESHIGDAVGEPVGKYWNSGRSLAAAAALAREAT